MKRFVVVDAGPAPAVLNARCADASFGVRLGAGVGFGGAPAVVDEHLVVDVDACRDNCLLDCADVLQGSRAHSVPDALRRLAALTSAHPSCGIAALPLAGAGGAGAGAGVSGWAVAGGSDRAVVLVPYGPHLPYQASGDGSLLPSCLHAWLVAGRSLREWPYARNARPSN
ncbi:hypothetical protein [Streptomyces sp. NBC_01716]|uniref:hypothetical protein n=1 Tax=Streptomyces sp. NBC_01716 TaxID=2975917 RepID=UPI002E2F380A|nr:hypothetical protein [Streptomyces sp. NBC_01716]